MSRNSVREAVKALESTGVAAMRALAEQEQPFPEQDRQFHRLLFVDQSRPGSRRWCSMQRCGNLAKVRSYRDRESD